MGILIGMDEAGYGPNLGPLVVAATAWRIDAPYDPASLAPHDGVPASAGTSPSATATLPQSAIQNAPDLYRLLRNIVSKSPSERRVPIADSKSLYSPGTGLRQLERGLHAVLHAMEQPVGCWSSLLRYCQADPESHHQRTCWPHNYTCQLPLHATADELTRLGTRFRRACDSTGIEPLTIRARMIYPEEFNNLVNHFGNKATALSHITIGLLRQIIETLPHPQPPIYAVCDKHGGRNFYTALLQHHFSEHWISPVFETRNESCYAWNANDSSVRVSFRMKGEGFLPTALASMTAKYLRELAMKAFNEFWRTHIPNLRPTAGYSVDARRFKRDIEAKQKELKIDDHQIWRTR